MHGYLLHRSAFMDLKSSLKRLGFSPSVGTPMGETAEYSKPPLLLGKQTWAGGAGVEEEALQRLVAKLPPEKFHKAYETWMRAVLAIGKRWEIAPDPRAPGDWAYTRCGFGYALLKGLSNVVLTPPQWNSYDVVTFDDAVAYAAAEWAYLLAFKLKPSGVVHALDRSTVLATLGSYQFGVVDGMVEVRGVRWTTNFSAARLLNHWREPPKDPQPAVSLWAQARAFLVDRAFYAVGQEAEELQYLLDACALHRWAVGADQEWGGVRRVPIDRNDRKLQRELRPKPGPGKLGYEHVPAAIHLRGINAAIEALELNPLMSSTQLIKILREIGGYSWRNAMRVIGGYQKDPPRTRVAQREQRIRASLLSVKQQFESELESDLPICD